MSNLPLDLAQDLPDIVIGSGPTGVAAAAARVALGRPVVILDGGKTPEPEALARRDQVAADQPGARAAYVAAQAGAVAGQVRRFGSDFAMESAATSFADAGGVAVRASRAVGGLSNLWGTAVLPFADHDMTGWPVSAADMAPHLAAVLRLVPVAGRRDAVEALIPGGLPEDATPVPPTAQAAAILDRFDRAAPQLAQIGLTAGQARQAVAAGCRACGLCLAGCPWGLMWHAGQALPGLGVTHRPGAVVRAVTQHADRVVCHLDDGGTVVGARVFLAAGVLETARIVLASGLADTLALREARHAFLPGLLTRANPRRPDRGALTTLPQVFLELRDAAVSPWTVHAQLYGWTEHYAPEMLASYGRGLALGRPLWAALARRLVVTQLFLHSDHWSAIGLRLAGDGRLMAEVADRSSPDALRPAAQMLARGLALAKIRALLPALGAAAPGASFHLGASLPMSARPGRGQSDILGRPGGAGRVHVVDASSLPAIPATTITLPAMAHAHRIGALAPA